MIRFFSTLRGRLMLLLLFSILPALGLMLYTFLRQRGETLERVKLESLKLTQVIAIDAEHFIEGTRQLLLALAQFPELQKGNAASCNRLFSTLLKQYPQFANIAAARAFDGTVFASALPMKSRVNVSDRSWFRQTLTSRDFAVGDYQIGRLTGKPTVNFSYPVTDARGEITAVVFAAFDLAWFEQLAGKVPLGKGVIFAIVDGSGTILVRQPDPERWVGKPMVEALTINALLNRGEATAEIEGPNDSPYLYTFSRLPYEGSRAFVTVGIPKKVLLASINKMLQGGLLILGLVAAAVLTVGRYVGNLLILRKIQLLSQAARRLASGDLDARSGLPYGGGEIGELARTFDEMAVNVKDREEKERALTRENETIATIGRIISSTLDTDEVFERLVDEIRSLMPFDRISINMLDPRGPDMVTVAYSWGVQVPERLIGQTYPLQGSATEMALKANRAFIVQGDDEEELMARFPLLIPSFQVGLRSKLVVPLISRDQRVGCIFLHARAPNAYTEDHLRLAEKVGFQIAGAVANAQLFIQHERAERELRQTHRALRVICDCNELVIRAEDEATLLRGVCRIITEVGGYRMAWVGYAEQDEQKTVRPVAQAGYEDGYIEAAKITWADRERGMGAMGRAIRTGRPCVINNILTDPNCIPWREEAERRGYASTIGIPLTGKSGTLGALGIYAAEPDAFDKEERELLVELGNDLAYGLEMLRVQAEKKEAEKSLLESAQQWRTTFDAIQDGVCLLDVHGRILRCNAAMARFLDRPFTDIVGSICYEVIHGTHEPVPNCPHVRMRETGQREQEVLRVGDRWIRVSVHPIFDEKGDLAGDVHIMSDITEQRQGEMRMASLEEEMRQAQKMEAVGRLAGGVAHDFNNLLTVIKGNSQLALLQLEDGSPLKEGMREIEKASDKAANLVRQLLAFSRRQIMEMRVIDLNALLGDVAKMLRRMIREDIELAIDLGENLGRVKADPGQIEQVIFNLVVNARDAMPEGGKLTITTANMELGEGSRADPAGLAPGSYVRLSVTDTGVGMTAEIRSRIFEPFFTTKEKGKGTGLGLSTVYGIVKQSGGEIAVESEPGRGTRFDIYLPRVDEPLEANEEGVLQEAISVGKETVLVVEDDDNVRNLAVRILNRQGYKVLEAANAGDALLICEQYEGSIDLLLTDVVMPRMSGVDLARRLHPLRPEMKVLYMSGYMDDVVSDHGSWRKEALFITKPFKMEALVQKVREVLGA